MQLIFKSSLILALLVLLPGCGTTSTISKTVHLVPGMTYYDGPEKLNGKLVFLLQHNYSEDIFSSWLTNSETAGSIYELDLPQKKFRKVTDSYVGDFIASPDGDVICVTYCLGKWSLDGITNVFIYSNKLGAGRHLRLEAEPQDTRFFGGHVYIELKGYDFKASGFYLTTNGSKSETNWVDYEVASGNLKTLARLSAEVNREYKDRTVFRTFDGTEIGFKGSGWPLEGNELVTASGKLIHRFFQMPPGIWKTYQMVGMSPDGHYAFVKTLYSRGDTYYLIDVSTGKARVLLQATPDPVTGNNLWQSVFWVQAGQKE